MTNKKVALISGITGQDGAYLARLLLGKGYIVHGIKRRSSSFNTQRVDGIYRDPKEYKTSFFLHYGDVTDATNIIRLVKETEPDEIYNLGAQSHVKVSFETPEYTLQADAGGTLRFLEAIRLLGLEKKTRFYQASSSELYGKTAETPQSEKTPFNPRSPYGIAKLYAYWITRNYRDAYGLFASNGILFNHESPLRGETFVTRKISRGVARVVLGLDKVLRIGNLDAKRDWGHAKEYVEGMWKILNHPRADDFVLATGRSISVRQFVTMAFKNLGVEIEFSGKGIKEKGVCKKTGKTIVLVDEEYYRPTEVDELLGNPTKAERELGWKAVISVEELCREMVLADYYRTKRELDGKEDPVVNFKDFEDIFGSYELYDRLLKEVS